MRRAAWSPAALAASLARAFAEGPRGLLFDFALAVAIPSVPPWAGLPFPGLPPGINPALGFAFALGPPGSGRLFSSAWLQPPAGLACGDSRAARSELAPRGNPQERLSGATRRSRAHKLLTTEGAAVCTCMQHARHQNRLYILAKTLHSQKHTAMVHRNFKSRFDALKRARHRSPDRVHKGKGRDERFCCLGIEAQDTIFYSAVRAWMCVQMNEASGSGMDMMNDIV